MVVWRLDGEVPSDRRREGTVERERERGGKGGGRERRAGWTVFGGVVCVGKRVGWRLRGSAAVEGV
jgi:hypothetical protein